MELTKAFLQETWGGTNFVVAVGGGNWQPTLFVRPPFFQLSKQCLGGCAQRGPSGSVIF